MATNQSTGLLTGLFDFSFTTFVTLKYLKIIYALLLAAILLGGIVTFFGLASQGGSSILVALVVVPLGTLLYLVLARMYMETLTLFFRIGENTSAIAATLAAGAPGASAAGPSFPTVPAS